MNITYMKASNLILAVIAALMIVGCGGHAGNGAECTRQQDSLLRRVDDSVRLQSPYAPLLIRQGMAAANDSVTYYEYYLRNAYVCFLHGKNDSTRYYADRTLAFALRRNPLTPRLHGIIGMAYMMRAAVFFHLKSSPDSALYYYQQTISHISQSCDKDKLPNVCANVADYYEQSNDIPKAAFWFRRALFLSDSLHLPQSTNVSINMGLARVYMQLRDFDSARRCYASTEAHLNELDPNMQIQFLDNYGNFFYYKKDYTNALRQFRRMKDMFGKSNCDSIDYNICLLNLSDVYLHLNHIDTAKQYLMRCEPFFVNNKIGVAIYYANTVKIGIALKSNDIGAAKDIISHERVAAPDEPNIVNIRNEYMREYYYRTGNYRKAYDELRDYVSANDSLEQNKTHMRAAEIMMRFRQDTLALHHQINMQAKEKEMNKAYSYIAVITVLAVITILLFLMYIFYTRRRRLEGQMRMLQLRMANIRNRISPHFIFNVLSNLINRHERISSADLLAVTQFIRTGLDMAKDTYASLKDEVEFTVRYVETTKQMIDDDFEFTIEKPADDVLESIVIPSMFLQILVENSIKHGLMGMDGAKCLAVNIRHDASATDIAVTDNGAGFCVDSIGGSSTKTGLHVIRQTLFIINRRNKQKMTFAIHNLTDDAGNIIGCRAELHIPAGIRMKKKTYYE